MKELETLLRNFLACFVEIFGARFPSQWWRNMYLVCTSWYTLLSHSENMPIYFPLRKQTLSIRSFVVVVVVFFVHNILCIPRKDDWWMRNVHKICSALNLTIICFKPFNCDNTTFSISVSFLNETYFSIN